MSADMVEKPTDMSELRPPIHIGKPGLRQILEYYQTSTQEMRHALNNECEVILECKVCRSLFRALPNFLAHKRVYCQKKYTDPKVGFVESRPETATMILQPADPLPGNPDEMDENVDGKPEEAHSEEYDFYSKVIERENWKKDEDKAKCTVTFSPIPTNPNAVRQEVVIEGANKVPMKGKAKPKPQPKQKEKAPEAKQSSEASSVSPEGAAKENTISCAYDKLKTMSSCNIQEMKCLICDMTYATMKSLYRHMTSFHVSKRTMYPCPYCPSKLTQLWGLTKHIKKNHGKTDQQVQKMREKLKKRAIQVKISPDKKVTTSPKSNKNASPERSPLASTVAKNPAALFSSSGTTLHKCEQCDRVFGKKDYLKRHMPYCMHPQPSTSGSGTDENKEENKTQQSPVKEVNPTPLSRPGIDILAGIGKEDLKKVQALVDEESQLCVKCDKRFSSVSSLHRHVVRHLGWKRFKCALCKFQCYNRSECTSHLQKVHKNIEAADWSLYIVDFDHDEVTNGQPKVDKPETSSGQSKRSLAFKNKNQSPKQAKITESFASVVKGGKNPKTPEKEVQVSPSKPPASPRTIQKLDFRGAELSSTTDKMLLATTTVTLEDLDEKRLKEQGSSVKLSAIDPKVKSPPESAPKGKKPVNEPEQTNGIGAKDSPTAKPKRAESKVKGNAKSLTASPSNRSQSPAAQTEEKLNKASPTVKPGQKRKASGPQENNLQVLCTRSGVSYKKPSLKEILSQRQEREKKEKQERQGRKPLKRSESRGSASGEDSESSESTPKRMRRSSPKPSTPLSENKPETRQPSSRSASLTRDKSANNAASPRSKVVTSSSEGNIPVSPRITSPTNRETIKTQSFYAKSSMPAGSSPSKPITIPTTIPIVSSPIKSSTASDLIRQASPLKSKLPMSPDTKAFDLTRAKVILSPLSSTSSTSTPIGVVTNTVVGTKIMTSSVLSPTPGTSRGVLAKPVAVKTSKIVPNAKTNVIPSNPVASPPGLPRLAPKPKPLPRPQKGDYIILIDNPRPIEASDVAAAIKKSGTKLSNECMYVLKDDQLTAVSRANPAVSGASNMGYQFALNTSPVTSNSSKVLAITNLAMTQQVPIMTTTAQSVEKPSTRSGQNGPEKVEPKVEFPS